MTSVPRALGSVSWVVPAAIHVGYILATFAQLPEHLGRGEDGTPAWVFIIEWFAIIGVANLAFALLHIRLPRLSDRMLAVPGKEYWLSTTELRAELVCRLRGICEVVLLMLNVFFLAVYQTIYQANTASPIIRLPDFVLIGAFMVFPLMAVVAHFLFTMHSLIDIARSGR